MTNEEAIKILDQMPIPASLNFTFEEMAEALQMAIEALKMPTVAEKIVFLAEEMEDKV